MSSTAASQPKSADELANLATFRKEVERLFPWMTAWLSPRDKAGPRPRDFLRTPLALSVLDVAPGQAQWIADTGEPWRALQRILQAFHTRNANTLCRGLPLHHAIVRNDPQEVWEILSASAHLPPGLIDGVAHNGHTALTLASMLGRAEILSLMLPRGAHVQSTDLLANTPCHWAAMTRDRAVEAVLRQWNVNGAVENLFGAHALDYDEAWNQVPTPEVDIDIVRADGSNFKVTDNATFRAHLGFTYLANVRPGIDFFTQMAVGLCQPSWLKAVHTEMKRCPPMRRDALPDVPMYFKDFGEPWGYGVCTRVPIATGDPVTSYVGDVVHTFETMVQLLNDGANPYMSNAQPTAALQQLFMSHFDAWESGNFGSRINSAEANGAQNLRFVCRFWRGLPRSQFYALRDIAAKEQLSWYYGDGYWQARGFPAKPLPRF